MRVKIGREFKPAPQFKTLYYVYLFLALFFLVSWWYLPLLFLAPPGAKPVLLLILLVVFGFPAWWIPKYYESMVYKLTPDEIVWKRGVWFRKTGIVPYNRITNIDIVQGPISRMLGIATLKIQTAGYSATSQGFGLSAEIKIEGVREFEELRDTIMRFVRGRKPAAVETYGKSVEERVLSELIRIRKLLEKLK